MREGKILDLSLAGIRDGEVTYAENFEVRNFTDSLPSARLLYLD